MNDQIPDTSNNSVEGQNSHSECSKQEASQNEWLKKLIESAPQLIDKYLTNSKQKDEARERRLSLISKHNRKLAYSLLVSMSIIIGIMAILTYLSKVSGDALLFLVGTIIGYILFMIQNLTVPM